MRAYVNYYDPDGARARANLKNDDIRDDESVIQFNASPHLWKMSRMEAEATRALLSAAIIRATIDPLHLCHFEVGEVGPEEHAIFCNDHPDFQVR